MKFIFALTNLRVGARAPAPRHALAAAGITRHPDHCECGKRAAVP